MKIIKISKILELSEPWLSEAMGEIEHREDIFCPFCKEKGFDLEGLKCHLQNGDCEVYNVTKTPARFF